MKMLNKGIDLLPLRYNEHIVDSYQKDMVNLCSIMFTDVASYVTSLQRYFSSKQIEAMDSEEFAYSVKGASKTFNQIKKDFLKRVSVLGKKYAVEMLESEIRFTNLSLNQALKMIDPELVDKDFFSIIPFLVNNTTNTELYKISQSPLLYSSEEMKNVATAVIAQNLQYMNSIGEQYLTDIEGAVMRSIGNNIYDNIVNDSRNFTETAIRRAKLIASDQAHKAHQSIAKQTMIDYGIKKFKWVYTYRSKESRPYHRDVLNGEIFDLDNPPVIDPKTGERGFPAQLPNCKCVMQPYIG